MLEVIVETFMQVGQGLPLKALGFHSVTELLKSVPDVCILKERGGALMVVGLPSSGTAHVLNMVNKQGKKQVGSYTTLFLVSVHYSVDRSTIDRFN